MRFFTIFPAIGMLITLSACPTPTPKKSIWVTGTYTAGKGCQMYAGRYKSADQIRHRYWYHKEPENLELRGSPEYPRTDAGIECDLYMIDSVTGEKISGLPTSISIAFSNLPFLKEDRTISAHSFNPLSKDVTVWAVFEAGMFANGLGSYQGKEGLVEIVKVKGEIVLIKFKILMSPT